MYFCHTLSARLANQRLFGSGSHSEASFATFCCLFTYGAAGSERFSRSDEKRFHVWESAAQSPRTRASERATMYSMSVSGMLSNVAHVRAIDYSSHVGDDVWFHRLWV